MAISGYSDKPTQITTPSELSFLNNPASTDEQVVVDKQNNGYIVLSELPFNVRDVIFKSVTDWDKPENVKMFCAIRLVCKAWNSLADTHVLSIYWNMLKGAQPSLLQALVQQIDQECEPEEAKHNQLSSNSASNHSHANNPFWPRFTRLTKMLQENGAPIPSDRLILGVFPSGYEQMQRQIDAPLVTAWDRIQQQINFGALVSQSANEIQMGLNDPIDAAQVDQIAHLIFQMYH